MTIVVCVMHLKEVPVRDVLSCINASGVSSSTAVVMPVWHCLPRPSSFVSPAIRDSDQSWTKNCWVNCKGDKDT